MSNGFSITISAESLIPILHAMKELDKASRNRIVRTLLREASKVLQAEAKSLAPKDTGFMAQQIKVRAGRRKKDVINTLVTIGERNFVGKAFYGANEDLGHKIGKRGTPNRTVYEGSGFIEEAFDNKGPYLQKRLPEMWWDAIAKELSRTKKG